MEDTTAINISTANENAWLVYLAILSFVLVVSLCIVLPMTRIVAMIKKRADKLAKERAGTIITAFDPPLGLSPAEIGMLYDTVCGDKEVRATLFDLAQKRIITLNSQNSVSVIDQQAYDHLPDYAKVAVRIFDQQTAKSDKQYSSHTIVGHIDSRAYAYTFKIPVRQTRKLFTDAVWTSLRDKGYKLKKYRQTFWQHLIYVFLGFWSLPWVGTVFFGGNVNDHTVARFSLDSIFVAGPLSAFILGIFLWPVYLLLSYFCLSLFIKIAGRYWINTKQVRQIWPQLEGYRRFLSVVDLQRIQFESIETPLQAVVDSLPYAIVFNLETKWQERLQGIELANKNRLT